MSAYLSACVSVHVSVREKQNVLIEINDYHGIFLFRSRLLVRWQLCDFSCPIDLLDCDLLHNFSTFTVHCFFYLCSVRNQSEKKLFIKYAGCLYSIKDFGPHAKINGWPYFNVALHSPMVKSMCTYWLGTHWNYYQWWFCKFFPSYLYSHLVVFPTSFFSCSLLSIQPIFPICHTTDCCVLMHSAKIQSHSLSLCVASFIFLSLILVLFSLFSANLFPHNKFTQLIIIASVRGKISARNFCAISIFYWWFFYNKIFSACNEYDSEVHCFEIVLYTKTGWFVFILSKCEWTPVLVHVRM